MSVGKPSAAQSRWPSSARLTTNRDFRRVQRLGSRMSSKHFYLYGVESELPFSRFGLTVSKKVDKRATVRNRIKRLLREVIRRSRLNLVGNWDIVIIARTGAQECSLVDVKKQINGTLKYHGLLRTRER